MGYKVTLHTPESSGFTEEIDQIIEFGPERIGHFLHFTEDQLQKVIEKGIVIEICPSSNSHFCEGHNFLELLKGGLRKYSICTDDILLCDSVLSQEWDIF